MNVTRKLQAKFVAVFMIAMVLFAVALGAAIYYERRAALERDCMVYLLNINNYENYESPEGRQAADREFSAYPPYFVLEISGYGAHAEITLGDFFLADQGLTPEGLMDQMATQSNETGVLSEYNVRYYNGIRQNGTHRISFIDISYIAESLQTLMRHIALYAAGGLMSLLLLSLILSRWFAKPARDAMKNQQRFVSSASHELKTPISIITANMDLLAGVEDLSDPNYEFCCDNIRCECERMSNLVGAMLQLARADSNRESQATVVDFSQLLEQEVLRFEVMAYDQKLSLETTCTPGLFVRGDEVQATWIIDTLIENALKYCSPNGHIYISLAPIGPRRLAFSVSSTGEEIPREMRERIFQPFYQIDSTSLGAGLGLSIAQEILTSMHGSLRLEVRDGQNRFTAELPLSTEVDSTEKKRLRRHEKML